MGKMKKVIAGVVVTALVGTGVGGGLLYVKKGSQKVVMVASVQDLATDYYGSDTTLSGNVYANATQRVVVDDDMVVEDIYVNSGDEVKPGDKLISFDMTLVEMELNIAKLKQQKLEQDLAAAKKRLVSLQNGGPIVDSSSDSLIDSGYGDYGYGDTSSEDDGSDMDLSSAGEMNSYLAAAVRPLLLTAISDEFVEGDWSDTEDALPGDDMTGEEEGGAGNSGSASDYYDTPTEDDGFSDSEDSYESGFVSDGSEPSGPEPIPTPVLPDGYEFVNPDDEQGDPDFTDGEEPFYQTLDYDTLPYQGSGTKEDPFLYLCSSAKGKVDVTGAFLNKMAGYNADGTILLQPGGYWYLLEFHANDTIGDYTERKASCTGYYLIEGTMLSQPVDRFAKMDFTLDGAMQYEDEQGGDPEFPGGSGGGTGGGDSSLTRNEAIKIQKNRIASLELDIKEGEINISKLEKKAEKKLITSKLDGVVTSVGDALTGNNADADAFIVVKSKDGYYVQGTVGELMLDQVQEGTVLNCSCYGEYGYSSFEAEVIQVSDYAVDGSGSYYYGDTNPNVSSYTFTAKILDESAQVSAYDWVDIQLEQSEDSSTGIVLSKAFVRTEDGVSYVYKDDNGVLKKQIVKVKANVYGGFYVMLSGGISLEDKIAFPYAKAVKEGVKTKVIDSENLDVFMGYDTGAYSVGLG